VLRIYIFLEVCELDVFKTGRGQLLFHSTHLCLLVRPGGNDDPNGQKDDRNDLQAREPLAPDVAGGQGGDAPAGAEDDVYGDGDVVAEGMVVQHVDGEEEEDVDQPAAEGHTVRSKEEGRAVRVELGDVARGGHEDELYEGEEGPFGDVRNDNCIYGGGAFEGGAGVPLSGSTLGAQKCQHSSGKMG
jgi:hypothetical protein